MKKLWKQYGQLSIYIVVAVIAISFFPRYDNAFNYYYEIGKPWGYNLMTAPFDFAIYKTDSEIQDEQSEAIATITPCFSIVRSDSIYVISHSDLDDLQKRGYDRVNIVDNHHFATTHPLSSLYTPKSAFQEFGIEYTPNIVYDTLTNNRLMRNARNGISLTRGMIQEGERIIDRGEIVTEATFQVLNSLARAYSERNITRQQSIFVRIGYAVLIIGVLIMFVVFLYTFRKGYFREWRANLFFALLITVMVISTFLILRYTTQGVHMWLIPFAWVSLLTTVFYDTRTALFLHIVTILIVCLAMPTPFIFLFSQLVVGGVVITTLKNMTRRSNLANSAFAVFCANAIIYTALTFAISGSADELQGRVYLFIFINGALVLSSYALIYLFERLFGLVSDVTLLELTNVNSELMHRFAELAPGTFQHTLQVSNLAAEAAKAIDAKVLLVRTGALYHDIGKMEAPGLFTENQMAGENPLLQMSYRDAAQAIIAHVTNGLKLAEKYRLPPIIRSFIASHHGNSLVRYFYNSAINHGEQVDESDFRYPGPKPTSTETAILMMADAVEARSRSLSDYTEDSIREMVHQMVDAQIADGQFDDSPISFRDVQTIKQTFTERLISIHHHRITYPTIKK